MGEERLTDEQLQRALGDGDIPAHFVDLLAAEVRDRRREEADRHAMESDYSAHRRHETASRVLAAIAPEPQGTLQEKARDAVAMADALLAALAQPTEGK